MGKIAKFDLSLDDHKHKLKNDSIACKKDGIYNAQYFNIPLWDLLSSLQQQEMVLLE